MKSSVKEFSPAGLFTQYEILNIKSFSFTIPKPNIDKQDHDKK
jgi:hypothetical protein